MLWTQLRSMAAADKTAQLCAPCHNQRQRPTPSSGALQAALPCGLLQAERPSRRLPAALSSYPLQAAWGPARPLQAAWGPAHPLQAAWGPARPLQAALTSYPLQAALGTARPLQAALTSYPLQAAWGTARPLQAALTSYPLQAAWGTARPLQAALTSYPLQAAWGTARLLQAAWGPAHPLLRHHWMLLLPPGQAPWTAQPQGSNWQPDRSRQRT